MRLFARLTVLISSAFVILLVLHFPFLRLPYYWDEAGYYVPAALDFMRHGLLIPRTTLPSGHTPLVMIYLGVLWRLFGYSPLVTRAAMVLIAAATVVATWLLGRRAVSNEAGVWAAALLALSPLFFAQSSLVFLDLAAALFTTLALIAAMNRRWALFALAASLAVLSKETAIILLPAIWIWLLVHRKERSVHTWALSAVPAAVLAGWALYYHSQTGFWTGNPEYLQYNLYSALAPLHILRAFVARFAEVLFQGFNWLVVAGSLAGVWWARSRKRRPKDALETRRAETFACHPERSEGSRFVAQGKLREASQESAESECNTRSGDFLFLALALIAVYIVTLSVVGGAILPRYMLPVFPAFYVLAAVFIGRLPKPFARAACCLILACFVAGWFINPPYPFPYEDNLAYVDFIRLHQSAAEYLESLPGDPVILTAWPATDELRQPSLGYVERPLRVVQVDDFAPQDFVDPPPFQVLYLYSRKWNPPDNWLTKLGPLRALSRRFYEYQPATNPDALAARFHLNLLKEFDDRGQWVKIYRRP